MAADILVSVSVLKVAEFHTAAGTADSTPAAVQSYTSDHQMSKYIHHTCTHVN